MSEGLTRLYDYQHEDGGWGWWKTDENHPFMTAYAVYGLLEAQARGLQGRQLACPNIGTRALKKLFDEYPRAVPDLKAYMAYVLTVAQVASRPTGEVRRRDRRGRRRRQAVEQAWGRRDAMTPYGQALLLLSLDALKDKRGGRPGAGADGAAPRRRATWRGGASTNDPLLDDFGDTSVEATAFVVKALAARDPKNPLLEPAVRWLLLNRNYGGWWSSTKQTAMALYGLLDYMRARNEGGGGRRRRGARERHLGRGRHLHARVAHRTRSGRRQRRRRRPARTRSRCARKAAAASTGRRRPSTTTRPERPSARGSRKLALVRKYYSLSPVRVRTASSIARRRSTGPPSRATCCSCDSTRPGRTTGATSSSRTRCRRASRPVQQTGLYELERKTEFWDGSRREYRDDRVVFFQESFTAGHYQFIYLLKVTTPGVFRAMPAQIAAMYVPDATASSDAQTLTVGAAPRSGGTSK